MMSILFAQLSVSLDGFIEDRPEGMDWFAGDATFDELLTSTVRSIDGMIFGRKAYEMGAAFWPTAGESATTTEVSDQIALMNRLPKYVLSRSLHTTDWANSRVVGLDDIPGVKDGAERPLAVFAGAQAFQVLLDARYVDEIRVIRYPVVLGGGTPLFAADGRRRRFAPIEVRNIVGGPTISRYAVPI